MDKNLQNSKNQNEEEEITNVKAVKSNESLAQKYDIPLEDIHYKPPMEHSSVLNALLNELEPIDFRERAGIDSSEALTRKHFIIISNEAILEAAKKNRWSLCMTNQSVYIYNGAYWKEQTKEAVLNFLGDAALRLGVDEFEAKHYRFREELYKQFFTTAYLPKPEKKTNEVIINLKNGTFVITAKSQYLRGFDRSDFVTYQLDFNYDPEAEAQIFQKYLNRVLPDRDLQYVLAEFSGYVFVKQKTLKLEKALILFGSGANGKSVFFEVMIALLGPENVSNFSLYSLTNESGYFRARIADKLLNYASEISPKMDSTFFKQLVSGEPIEARLPYKEPFLMSDYAKLIFNTNILPKDIENNEAFYRRFTLIPFSVTIPEEERDPMLPQKIINNELAGVFIWVLEGLKRLLKNGRFTPSDVVDRSIQEYRQQSDTVYLFLDEENYVGDPAKETSLTELYNQYNEYCKGCNYKACSRRTFAERLRTLGYKVIRRSHGNMVGVRKKDF